MAIETKKKEETPEKSYHEALKSERMGSNKDGSARININQGDRLALTDEEVISYRDLKIIK